MSIMHVQLLYGFAIVCEGPVYIPLADAKKDEKLMNYLAHGKNRIHTTRRSFITSVRATRSHVVILPSI